MRTAAFGSSSSEANKPLTHTHPRTQRTGRTFGPFKIMVRSRKSGEFISAEHSLLRTKKGPSHLAWVRRQRYLSTELFSYSASSAARIELHSISEWNSAENRKQNTRTACLLGLI